MAKACGSNDPAGFTPEGIGHLDSVVIFRDVDPWGSTTDLDVLAAHHIEVTICTSALIGNPNLNLSAFADKVILCNQQPLAFYNVVVANRAWFEAYVAQGGCLLNGMANSSGDLPIGTMFPGGVTYGPDEGCNNIVTISDPAHEIFNTPNVITEAELQGWGCSSTGDIGNGGATLLTNADESTGAAVLEHGFGMGMILSTTQPYQLPGANANFAENLILYMPCIGVVSVEKNTWGSIKSYYRE